MIWIYSLMMLVDGILPIILKSCPLYWALGIVTLLMTFFSNQMPRAVKWMLFAVLVGIGTVSAILFLGSAYATAAYPMIMVQAALVTALVLMTPTTPRRKKAEAFFLKLKPIFYTL